MIMLILCSLHASVLDTSTEVMVSTMTYYYLGNMTVCSVKDWSDSADSIVGMALSNTINSGV